MLEWIGVCAVHSVEKRAISHALSVHGILAGPDNRTQSYCVAVWTAFRMCMYGWQRLRPSLSRLDDFDAGVALFLSLALIAVALAACGGDGVTTAPEASDGEGRQSERESRAGTHAPRRSGTRRRERQPAHHQAGGDGGGWRRHAHAGRRRWRAKGQVHIGQRRGVTPAG